MSLLQEFKTFAMRGNVIDMAVGIILGAAFGKIVSSLVNDVIMPPIGLLIGGINFTDIKITLKSAAYNGSNQLIPAVTLNIGSFIQTLVDFIIIAFAIFMMIKAMNQFHKKKEKPASVLAPSNEEKLLTEIRDILKTKK
ncbi:MAG: Large-conductance mechanosensitive channel [Bacteroidetes bacterium ADurb.Bin012]|jgi:large conductance mechanosensitive channel|nr:MAG: Large-conductance mechanosensitive channel [Bacteroidetes bacterium ADurb.Bin012]